MGALVSVLVDACHEELDKIASSIEGEMKGFVGGHTRTGQALGSIHIEVTGEMSRFVGGNSLHLYYLNEGNGGGPIKSTRKVDRAGREPGKLYLANGRPPMYAPQVSSYAGFHFVEMIASHY